MNEMRKLMEAVEKLDEEFVEYRDPDGQFMVIHVGRKGYRAYGSGAYKDKISPEMFDDLGDAIEHAEICMGIEDETGMDAHDEYMQGDKAAYQNREEF